MPWVDVNKKEKPETRLGLTLGQANWMLIWSGIIFLLAVYGGGPCGGFIAIPLCLWGGLSKKQF